MKILLSAAIPGAIVGAALAADELRTRYSTETALRVTSETEITLETTDFSMERDGEPIDTSRFGGGGPSTTTVRVAYVDAAGAVSDDGPTSLKRSFEAAEREGDEDSVESPLAGEVLVLTLDDGDVSAELESGASPDRDSVLEGHRLTLTLDAFLAEDGASSGSWTVDGEAVLEGLGITQSAALFPRPEGEPDGGGGRGERGGERRGPPGGRGASTANRILNAAEWDATASVEDETADVDGVECVVIALELEGEGELEDEGMFGRGRRGGRSLGAGAAASALLATEFEIDLEGRLFFSADLGRPVKLEIEGEFTIEMEMTREREDMTMSIYRAQEGTFNQTVTVVEEASAQ